MFVIQSKHEALFNHPFKNKTDLQFPVILENHFILFSSCQMNYSLISLCFSTVTQNYKYLLFLQYTVQKNSKKQSKQCMKNLNLQQREGEDSEAGNTNT